MYFISNKIETDPEYHLVNYARGLSTIIFLVQKVHLSAQRQLVSRRRIYLGPDSHTRKGLNRADFF